MTLVPGVISGVLVVGEKHAMTDHGVVINVLMAVLTDVIVLVHLHLPVLLYVVVDAIPMVKFALVAVLQVHVKVTIFVAGFVLQTLRHLVASRKIALVEVVMELAVAA